MPLCSGGKAAEQSCHLGLYDRGNITVVAQVHGPNNWGMSIRLGVKVNLVDTGSGHALLAFQSDARRAGADAFLGKPFALLELLELLDRLLDG